MPDTMPDTTTAERKAMQPTLIRGGNIALALTGLLAKDDPMSAITGLSIACATIALTCLTADQRKTFNSVNHAAYTLVEKRLQDQGAEEE